MKTNLFRSYNVLSNNNDHFSNVFCVDLKKWKLNNILRQKINTLDFCIIVKYCIQRKDIDALLSNT
jgi:hypothetical protein